MNRIRYLPGDPEAVSDPGAVNDPGTESNSVAASDPRAENVLRS